MIAEVVSRLRRLGTHKGGLARLTKQLGKFDFGKLDLSAVGGWPGFGRDVSAGSIAALSALTNCFAYGALIFSGPLHPFLAQGIAASLMTCVATALVYAVIGRFQTAIAAPVANTSALLAVVTASLGPAIAGSAPGDALALALTALFVSTISAAGALLLLGSVHAGKFVRYIPYPVIAGFMGATGWLVVVGAVKMATDVPLAIGSLPEFAQPRGGLLLALLLAWTGILWVATKKIRHPLTLPVALAAGAVVTNVALQAFGVSHTMAQSEGLLFSVSRSGWQGIPALSGTYFHVDWSALLPVTGAITAVALISVLQTLFLATGLELTTRTEIDLDKEMRSIGWANLASAALGGFVGQIALSATTVNRAAGGRSRITGIVVGLIVLFSLLGANTILDFTPRFVLGGALLLQGLRLLDEWAVKTYPTVSYTEWLLVLGIVTMTAWVGFVPAELGGLLGACVLFALSVSRVDIIRTICGLDERSSSLVRSEQEMRVLAAHGAQVQVVELRGYVFFGSAYHMREQVKAMLVERRLRMMIFDLTRVVGIDSSAATTMVGMARWLRERGVQQLVVGASSATLQALRESSGFKDEIILLSDLDEALERGENAVLAAYAAESKSIVPFSDWLSSILGNAEFARTLQQHLVKSSFPRGSYVCRQGDPSNDLYFIEEGRLSAVIEANLAAPKRVRVFGRHTQVGEIAFILGVPRTASLRVDEDTVVWSLGRSAFAKLEETHPGLMVALLQHVLRLQAERLSFSTRQITALQR